MALLLDGYNVLYAVGILGHGVGPHTLERARLALLNFLAEALPPDEVPHTTVVFDAAAAPADLPHTERHRGLHVRFSVGYENADALLAELIRTESAPRRLTVVSNDRQVQQAARRRRAKAVEVETWWDETERRRRQRHAPVHPTPAERTGPLSAAEVAYWLKEFGSPAGPGTESETKTIHEKPSHQPPSKTPPSQKPPERERPVDLENPFPPGYGEDLLEGES